MAFIDEIKKGLAANKINNEDLLDLYCDKMITMEDLLKGLEYYYYEIQSKH